MVAEKHKTKNIYIKLSKQGNRSTSSSDSRKEKNQYYCVQSYNQSI